MDFNFVVCDNAFILKFYGGLNEALLWNLSDEIPVSGRLCLGAFPCQFVVCV